KSGKNVGVIGLGDMHIFPAETYRWKRTAGTDQRPPLGPIQQVLRVGFAAGDGVRERKDDWTNRMFGHLANRIFRESSLLTRHSDQDRRLRMADHIQERDFFAWLRPIPNFFLLAGVG